MGIAILFFHDVGEIGQCTPWPHLTSFGERAPCSMGPLALDWLEVWRSMLAKFVAFTVYLEPG